jgi:hypothetical protein
MKTMFQAFAFTFNLYRYSAVRVPDDLFIDDSANDSGFFSFLQPPRAGITGGSA